MVDVRQRSIRELFSMPEFIGLRDEYMAECALAGMRHSLPRLEYYGMLEDAGVLTVYCAFHGGRLVGFVTLVVAPIAHYGVPMMATESIFVGSEHRKTGAGLALLRAAEEHAKNKGIHIMQVSAPLGGRFERVMSRQGYECTNVIFTKRFSHE